MTEVDEALEEFRLAQGGAMAHLETMAQAARDAAEGVLTAGSPPTGSARLHAQRLGGVADACDALRVLVELVDVPADVDTP